MTINIQLALIFKIAFLFTFSLTAQDVTHPFNLYKGKVLKVYESNKQVFLRKDLWIFEKSEFQHGVISTFDDKGNYKTSDVYITPGDPFMKTRFKVNAKGNFISSEIFSTSGQVSKVRFHENKAGLIDSVIYSNTKNKEQYRLNTYEYKKKKLIAFTQEQIGRDSFRVEYKLSKGKVEAETVYDYQGNITAIKKHDYNKAGDPTLTKTYTPQNELINQKNYIYRYDKKGNWVKRLATDIGLDERILTERTIIYKGAPTKNVSKKELLGYWKGWGDGIALEVKKTLAKVAIKNIFRSNTTEGEYSYSSSTGILSIISNGWQKQEKDFYTSFDGTILTLESHERGLFYYLKKVSPEELTLSQRKEYQYKSTVEKPTAKPFKENGKYGLKSKSGKVFFSPKYESVYAIGNDCVKVSENNKYGLADYTGKLLTECKYDAITRRQQGYFRIEINYKKGLLNPKGEEIVSPVYDNIWVDPAGVIIVEEKNKKGILSLDNKIIAEPKYNSLGKSQFNRIFAYSGGIRKHDWYDGQYQLVKTLERVSSVKAVDVNCFKFRGAGGWGLMDSLGNIIMQPQYDELRRTSAQLLIASDKAGKHALVNTSGQQLTDLKYDRILGHYNEDYNNDLSFNLKTKKAAALFMRGETFGYLDGFGKEILPEHSPSLHLKSYYKTFEEAANYQFIYPYSWKKGGSYFSSNNKDARVGFRFEEFTYSGDPQQWIINNERAHGLKSEIINGISTYSYFRESPIGRNNTQLELISFFPISENKIIRIAAYSPKFQYLKNAQTFYDIVHSFKLK